jgi:hypothetical protein
MRSDYREEEASSRELILPITLIESENQIDSAR